MPRGWLDVPHRKHHQGSGVREQASGSGRGCDSGIMSLRRPEEQQVENLPHDGSGIGSLDRGAHLHVRPTVLGQQPRLFVRMILFSVSDSL